jgi:hypothetical protein
MASMIENLIGGAVKRRDNKRILPIRRPLPTRPRDLMELFCALGAQADMTSLMLTAEFRDADPRGLTFTALSRWPTTEELAAVPTPFVVARYMRTLLLGQEFRTHLFRRICDAYPERPRQFFIRLPRCAGHHFLHMASRMHPIFPETLSIHRRGDEAEFLPALGAYLSRFTTTRTIMASAPSLAAFTQPPAPAPTPPPRASLSPYLWALDPPAYRPGDRLFTILREPQSLILSQVNAILAGLQADPAQDTAAVAGWRSRIPHMPDPTDFASWRSIGRQILAGATLRNPICTALGDGTAQGAREACRLWNIEICDLARYENWVRFTWDTDPEPPTQSAPTLLAKADLGPGETTTLQNLVGEDAAFYARVADGFAKLGEFDTSLHGNKL